MPKKTITHITAPKPNRNTRKNASVLKRWKDLTFPEKYREILKCAARHGGRAVSLNLSPAVAYSLVNVENPTRWMSKRMKHCSNQLT